jgi:hypothetical protein
LGATAASLRSGEHPLRPFHWAIEFPEVFARESAGFDAIVGNPPFLGGKDISGSFSSAYLHCLHERFEGSSGQVDLVAFFFRRAFDLIRKQAALGLLATKTIAEGDTRRAGLANICKCGGTIFRATKRIPWSGEAAVTVSAVWIRKGRVDTAQLDGRSVAKIGPYLVPGGLIDEPSPAFRESGKGVHGVLQLW